MNRSPPPSTPLKSLPRKAGPSSRPKPARPPPPPPPSPSSQKSRKVKNDGRGKSEGGGDCDTVKKNRVFENLIPSLAESDDAAAAAAADPCSLALNLDGRTADRWLDEDKTRLIILDALATVSGAVQKQLSTGVRRSDANAAERRRLETEFRKIGCLVRAYQSRMADVAHASRNDRGDRRRAAAVARAYAAVRVDVGELEKRFNAARKRVLAEYVQAFPAPGYERHPERRRRAIESCSASGGGGGGGPCSAVGAWCRKYLFD